MTSFLQGIVHFREHDDAPVRALATGLPGINSIAFDMKGGKLYASQVFLGDALWEIALDGKPPRLIAKDLGGLNGFEVGLDGLIYGPLWFKHQVARVDPANGAITPISDQFKTPAAANLDGKGNLWVVDARTGELSKVELATGRMTLAKQFAPAVDNLAIAPEGTIYVSNMADNAVHAYDPASGSLRTLTSGKDLLQRRSRQRYQPHPAGALRRRSRERRRGGETQSAGVPVVAGRRVGRPVVGDWASVESSRPVLRGGVA